MVAQRIAPGTDGCRGLAAPAAPTPGRSRVVNSDTWSLSYRFTHSLLTNLCRYSRKMCSRGSCHSRETSCHESQPSCLGSWLSCHRSRSSCHDSGSTCHGSRSSCHDLGSTCHYTIQRQPVQKYSYVQPYCPPVQTYYPPAPYCPQYTKNICKLPPTYPKY
ncbi:hypothetical protein Q9233_012625 [Columba guinea]|nr:hypothetical protein Q9233_012625 [Columba guinea]